MDVGAAAGLVHERLGHEAGDHALLLGNRLDRALEIDRVVAGQHRVVAMLEIDLELAGRVFGDSSVGRNVLRGAGVGDRVGEPLVIVEILQVIDLRGGVAFTGGGVARGRGPAAGIEFAIEQVELQLYRDHRGQAALAKALHHALEHFARIGGEHAAVGVFHCQQQLRHWPRLPRHWSQRARHRPADAILIADVVTQSGLFHGVAGDVGGDQRHRQTHAIRVYFFQCVAGDAFATQQAVHVGQDQVDRGALRHPCEGGGVGGRQIGLVHGSWSLGVLPDTSRGGPRV